MASYLQHLTVDPGVKHLTEGSKFLKQFKQLLSTLKYLTGDVDGDRDIFTLADASFNISARL